MLIVSPRNQNDLLRKALQSRYGSGRAGCDRVIVITDAVQLSHQFNAMLHAAESFGKGTDRFDIHQPFHRSNGSHVIFYIVVSGK